jgi:glutathione S-transferase
MKLYTHPVSTVARPVEMFPLDHAIAAERQVVDLFRGEQYGAEYAAVNPNNAVPVLEDGDFRMAESSAILKYLADSVNSPTYPKDPKERARVNEAMDWLNTALYRTFGYGLCYPRLLDHMRLADAAAQAGVIEQGRAGARRYLAVMNDHMLGGKRAYLCGDSISIADYLASGILSMIEVIGGDFSAWPHVGSWFARMKARPNWEAANGAVAGWARMARGPAYVML